MAENEGGGYDPYEHRDVKRPNTNFETAVHILKGAIGTGILAMPGAFSNTGWISGLMATMLVGVIVVYCLDILLKSIYLTCQRERVPFLTYSDAMRVALTQGPQCMQCLAKPSSILVDIFLCIKQIGTCTIYVVFIGKNLKQVCDQHVVVWNERIWMAIVFIPILALALIPDLKRLAPVSILGNILTLCGLSMVMYYIFTELPSIKDREKFVDIIRFPLFLGTVLFAIEPVAVVVTVQANMKNPRDLTGPFGVLSLSLLASALLYTIFGFVGFWRYGQEALGSITLNIPTNEWIAHSIRIIYMTAILVSLPLQGYVLVDIIWNQHLSKHTEGKKNMWIYEYIVRAACVTFTTLLAIALPRLALFISFIGVFSLSALGFIFIGMLHMCIHWPDKLGRLKYMLIRDIVIIVFGFIALISGTYVTVSDIVRSI